MTYEIGNMDLHFMYRNRLGPILRRKCRSVVWPRRPDYDATVYDTFRDADEANEHVEAELNGMRVGNVVQPPVMPARGHWGQINIDGKRKATGRSGDDVRDVDSRETRAAAKARWKACEDYACPGWFKDDCDLCVARQRAGMCPALTGSDMRSDTSGVQGSGRKPA